uniref:Uncharacterized protein n=1 Tax=Arundo donax TaxID=35708 RepID=A0A0A9QEQ3_ARUDO
MVESGSNGMSFIRLSASSNRPARPRRSIIQV